MPSSKYNDTHDWDDEEFVQSGSPTDRSVYHRPEHKQVNGWYENIKNLQNKDGAIRNFLNYLKLCEF